MLSTVPAARSAVLDLLGLLREASRRIDQAPVRRGRPATTEVWRALLADRSADAFPRRLGTLLRVARERVGPLRPALRAGRRSSPYPATAAGVQAHTAAEFVLAVAEQMRDRIADGLPDWTTRTWVADDEIRDLAGRLTPLLASLTPDLAADAAAEFDTLRMGGE
jgi:hypothetical protein